MIKKEPKADLYSHKIPLYFFHYKTTIVVQKSFVCLAFHSTNPMLLALSISSFIRGSRSFSTLLSSTASLSVCFN